MKKQPNPKVFMGLTALTLIGAVGAAMFQYSSLQDTQNLVSKLRKDSLDETTLENQLKSSEAQLKQCGARLNHLEKGVPALEYVPTMLKELESIGKDNGLEILGIRPVPKVVAPKDSKDKKSGNKYAELDIEVTSRGSFGGLQKFMHALQSFPKVVAVRTVAVLPKQVSANEIGPPKLEITIQLRSYLFPPNKDEMKKANEGSQGAPQGAQPAGPQTAQSEKPANEEAKRNVS